MVRLIINADDYGLTPGINRGIQALQASGSLTSATIMAGTVYAQQAAAYAGAHPAMGAGCHIVLVDGDPVAPAAEIASLLRPGAPSFYRTLGEFLWALLSGLIQPKHIEREARAQLVRLQGMGIKLTHVDTHKHTHMFPAVLRPVLDAAKSAGIRAVRNPFEPEWSVRATPAASWTRKAEVNILRALYARQFAFVTQQWGFTTSNGTMGIAATGSLDEPTLRSILQAMPEGTWELVCHPGHVDAALLHVDTRLRQSREIEFECLQDLPSLLPLGTTLHTYGDLIP